MSSGSYPPGPPAPPPIEPGSFGPAWNGPSRPVFRPLPPRPKPRIWLHVLLFLLTVVSTTMMGGFAYSACLLTILGAHEFGHYFAARYYRVDATLPYFIPFPSLFGTLGAVIRMSPLVPNRRALFDIAAAGPLAGLVVAIPVSFVGIALSERAVPDPEQSLITLGDPLLFKAMEWMFFGARAEGIDLMLHPIGFAGWVGLFVTALNLLPVGQLDGGHISYALFGRRAKFFAGLAFAALLALTLTQGYHYMLILIVLWFMGLKHPTTVNDAYEVGQRRRGVGILLAIVFVTCFSPVPVEF